MSKQLFDTLMTNLIDALEDIKAVAIVDREGLIIASKMADPETGEDALGAAAAMFDSFLKRVKTEFGSAEEFVNVMTVDKNKFLFADAGSDAILSIIGSPDTEDNRLKVFGEHMATKIELILKGEEVDLTIPPIVEVLANMKSGKLPNGEFSEKLIVLGDPMVGKTSLIKRYVDNKFQENYISTIGVDISRKTVDLGKTCKISFTIWDIGGQSQNMVPYRKRFYQGANMAILQFDITRRKTYEDVDNWVDDLRKSIDRRIPVILIANKTDLPNHEVEIEEIKKKSEELNCPFLLCSAKTGSNVNDAFKYAGFKFCENL